MRVRDYDPFPSRRRSVIDEALCEALWALMFGLFGFALGVQFMNLLIQFFGGA